MIRSVINTTRRGVSSSLRSATEDGRRDPADRWSTVRRALIIYVIGILSIATAQVSFQWIGSDAVKKLPTRIVDGQPAVSIPAFFGELQCTSRWDMFSQTLTVTRQSTGATPFVAVFSQDVRFCLVNDRLFQLATAPRRISATIYLPVADLVALVAPSFTSGLSWSPQTRTVLAFSAKPRLMQVKVSISDTGAAIECLTTDSVSVTVGIKPDTCSISFGQTIIDPAFSLQDSVAGQLRILSLAQQGKRSLLIFKCDSGAPVPTITSVMTSAGFETTVSLIYSAPKFVKPKTAPVVASANIKGIRPVLRTIVIDPGHGGKDPGAIGTNGLQEKNIALAVALGIKKQLEARSSMNVFLTRSDDTFIPLQERTKFANRKKADIFVSIHLNSIDGNQKKRGATKGYKVFFLSQAKNDEDKLIAMKENSVIELEDPNTKRDFVENILIDMANNEYLRESQDFSILLSEMYAVGLSGKIPRLHLGVGQANFWVLNGAYMPSVLIELGFISNPEEERLMDASMFQKKIAATTCDAILGFKDRYEKGL